MMCMVVQVLHSVKRAQGGGRGGGKEMEGYLHDDVIGPPPPQHRLCDGVKHTHEGSVAQPITERHIQTPARVYSRSMHWLQDRTRE